MSFELAFEIVRSTRAFWSSSSIRLLNRISEICSRVRCCIRESESFVLVEEDCANVSKRRREKNLSSATSLDSLINWIIWWTHKISNVVAMSQRELREKATPYNDRENSSIRWQAHKRDNSIVSSLATKIERRISRDSRQHRVRSRELVECWCRFFVVKFDLVADSTDDDSRWRTQLRAASRCENKREDLSSFAMLSSESSKLSLVAFVLLSHRQIFFDIDLTLNAPTYTKIKKKISNASFLQNIFFEWDICSRHSRFRTRVSNRRRLFLECSRDHRCFFRKEKVSRDQSMTLSRDWLESVSREKRTRDDRKRDEILWDSLAEEIH